VLEVATIWVQTGLNPALHILEGPFFPISANNKHALLHSITIHFPTILCELTIYTNTHELQPYCVGTLSQMTERSAERRVRQGTGWIAGGPLLRVPTVRRSTDTHYRHTTDTLRTRTRHTTDTHYRHALQTRNTDTHYRHITDTH
jgi:hypothetical protein